MDEVTNLPQEVKMSKQIVKVNGSIRPEELLDILNCQEIVVYLNVNVTRNSVIFYKEPNSLKISFLGWNFDLYSEEDEEVPPLMWHCFTIPYDVFAWLLLTYKGMIVTRLKYIKDHLVNSKEEKDYRGYSPERSRTLARYQPCKNMEQADKYMNLKIGEIMKM